MKNSAFENAVVAALPRLRRYALQLTRSSIDADDLVQDVMLRVLHKQHRYVEGDLRAWMFTILHNCYVTGIRRSVRRTTVPLNEYDNIVSHTNANAGVLAREVVEEIEKLPLAHRRIIKRIAIGATYDETAHRERIPIGTVRSRVARVREKLREFAG